ncbi:MAG: hypothetical protein LBS29_03540 [Endomicrobium sp.]|jgi:hypothetical protein|nr:hypothetical protein [Endomicrobium sp.]
MNKLEISPDFTVDDIHNLRIYIGEIYRSMSKEEAEKDFDMHYQRGKKAIENLRKLNR